GHFINCPFGVLADSCSGASILATTITQSLLYIKLPQKQLKTALSCGANPGRVPQASIDHEDSVLFFLVLD
ncbi:MAG: hypothetical protein J7K58_02865, partial [Euryarchaeota archaeon]|nr:hypothetical protein [Euryarchaeota archaeon]